MARASSRSATEDGGSRGGHGFSRLVAVQAAAFRPRSATAAETLEGGGEGTAD